MAIEKYKPARDENGRWLKGYSGNPDGAKPQAWRDELAELRAAAAAIFRDELTPEDWRKMCRTAISQAKSGDRFARDWVTRLLIGSARESEVRNAQQVVVSLFADGKQPEIITMGDD